MAFFAVCTIAGSASAFEFVNSEEAMNVGGGIGFGGYGGFNYFFQAELPPYGDLAFLALIPGFGMDLIIGKGDGLLVQNALCLRAKVIDQVPVKAGFGIGLDVFGDETAVYAPIVVGGNYLISDNFCAGVRLTIPVYNSSLLHSGVRFDIGASWATGY
jgi:hypothetical protein